MDTRAPAQQQRIKDRIASERPQERLEKYGGEALSDSELLAMILRSGPRGMDVVTLAQQLLQKANPSAIFYAGRLQTFKKFTALAK